MPAAGTSGVELREDARGDEGGGVRGVPAFESAEHGGAGGLVGDDLEEVGGELFAGGFALFEHVGGTRFDVGAGVEELMIVRRAGIGNEHGRHAQGGEFRERGRAGAADGDGGRSEGEFHLGEEGTDGGFGLVLIVGGLRFRDVVGSGEVKVLEVGRGAEE